MDRQIYGPHGSEHTHPYIQIMNEDQIVGTTLSHSPFGDPERAIAAARQGRIVFAYAKSFLAGWICDTLEPFW